MADVRQPSRVLGHLVAPRLVQGEVLTTAGLEFLLRDPVAGDAFAGLLGIDDHLTWELETTTTEVDPGTLTAGSGRVDLVGRTDDKPVCAIEAKIHQKLEALQLLYYARWQERELISGALPDAVLAVLVPEWRRTSAQKLMDDEVKPFAALREFRVITWEEAFDAIQQGEPAEEAGCDLAQVIDLYRQYDASHVGPFTLEETTTGWQNREADYKRLANQLTCSVQEALFAAAGLPNPKLLPLVHGGRYRYIRVPLPGTVTPGMGMFPGLEGNPFSIRYNAQYTAEFNTVAKRLEESLIDVERVQADGGLSIRLQIPVGAAHYEMLRVLTNQVFEVLQVAHPELTLPPRS